MTPTIEVHVSRIISGNNVLIKTAVEKAEDVPDAVNMLATQMNGISGPVEAIASVSTAIPLPMGVTPSPLLDGNVLSMPILEGAPASYKIGDAVLEILNPNKSAWAQTSRAVAEIQKVLQDIGVRGVSNLQTFDSTVRALLKQGKLRRERVDNVFKYYVPAGV